MNAAFGALQGDHFPVILAEIARLVVVNASAFTRNSNTGKLRCVALFRVDPHENLYGRENRQSALTMPLDISRQPLRGRVEQRAERC